MEDKQLTVPSDPWPHSYVRNCYVNMREGTDFLFYVDAEGRLFCHLDGYAIVPKEEYFKLRDQVS
jgi:hypothetical protein